jgi:hypothetical protein
MILFFSRYIMKSLQKKIFHLCLIIIISANSSAFCQTFTITGKIFDKDDRRIITSGVLLLNPGNRKTTTSQKGEFSFSCPAGIKQLSTQVLGYKPLTMEVKVNSDTVVNLYLQVMPFELGEVTVLADSIQNVKVTHQGNFRVTPAAVRETPRLFSEPDLMKSLQLIPGVVGGKDGNSDIYVRGGGAGQNIILANGCYFFLPSHFLGIISSIDLDFLESAELYKDYFPAELGGGAGSVISLQFKKPQSDSLHAQLRLGMLSSGITFELPVKKLNLAVTAGLKRGNYFIYKPFLKRVLPRDIYEYLPNENYTFYDGFFKVSFSSKKLGNFNYLYFGNYDKGSEENEISSKNADTTLFLLDRITESWRSSVHAFRWESPASTSLKWKFDLNYDMLSTGHVDRKSVV